MNVVRRNALPILNAALVVAVFFLAVVMLFVFASPEPYDPIRYSPRPRPVERLATVEGDDAVVVVPLVAGFDGPAVRIDETVPTTGLVCNTDDEPVDVLSDVTWERWDVRGTRVAVLTDFPSQIAPDCSPLAFENPIPDEVRNAILEAGEPQRWIITGSATPTAPGGVPATWRIEPFWIVP